MASIIYCKGCPTLLSTFGETRSRFLGSAHSREREREREGGSKWVVCGGRLSERAPPPCLVGFPIIAVGSTLSRELWREDRGTDRDAWTSGSALQLDDYLDEIRRKYTSFAVELRTGQPRPQPIKTQQQGNRNCQLAEDP